MMSLLKTLLDSVHPDQRAVVAGHLNRAALGVKPSNVSENPVFAGNSVDNATTETSLATYTGWDPETRTAVDATGQDIALANQAYLLVTGVKVIAELSGETNPNATLRALQRGMHFRYKSLSQETGRFERIPIDAWEATQSGVATTAATTSFWSAGRVGRYAPFRRPILVRMAAYVANGGAGIAYSMDPAYDSTAVVPLLFCFRGIMLKHQGAADLLVRGPSEPEATMLAAQR